jgi:hypothetical protein
VPPAGAPGRLATLAWCEATRVLEAIEPSGAVEAARCELATEFL